MAVRRGTRRAGVLGRDAARFRPFLEEAGLVDDEHAARRVAEVLDDVGPQIVAHRVRVPDGGVEQALHALGPRLPERLGEVPAVLALHSPEQASEVTLRPLARLGTGEAVGDPPMQRRQRVRPALDRRQSHGFSHDLHPPLPYSRGKSTRQSRYLSL